MLIRLRTWLGLLADDVLPMTAEDREERDWTGETSKEEAERRELEMRIEMLEKKSRGGGFR